MFRVCPPITTAFIGPPLPKSVLFSVAPLYEGERRRSQTGATASSIGGERGASQRGSKGKGIERLLIRGW